ncbi:MAG: hypothetical protein LUH07_07460 [Lachnospiraceae bacterium]|nr:hypothetical protein [Lachnospiraceae bacterium]
MRRGKKTIVNIITGIAALMFIFGACMLDSEDLTLPLLLIIPSLLWLVPYAIRSDQYITREDYDEDHMRIDIYIYHDRAGSTGCTGYYLESREE